MRRYPSLTPLCVLALFGCAVGPDYVRPATLGSAPSSALLGPEAAAQDATEKAWRQDWWQLFHAPKLNALVDEALRKNADLAAAQAALRVAQENASANFGVFYPNLSGNLQISRQKDATGTVQPTAADSAPSITLYTPQLTVTYGPDLWGGYRRGQESADALTESQFFQTTATRQAVVANVIVAAITEASQKAQFAAYDRMRDIQRQSLTILQRQRELGQASDLDVAGQEAALGLAEQSFAAADKQWQLARHQLAALLGRMPGDMPDSIALSELSLPEPMPAALPSDLVENRPDIRQAEANLKSASAQIGVAIANRLPSLQLTGEAGSTAKSMSRLFMPGNGQWTLGASVTAPLFDGFTLLHKERAARAAYDQAEAQYRSTVITAFQNVADSLAGLRTDEQAYRAALLAKKAAARGYELARKQWEVGQIAPLTLLGAEQTALSAQITLIQAEAGRYADGVALLQSLGGGWWQRDQNKAEIAPMP